MSDAVAQNLKISREGIVLIKSLEGFRPHALRRGNHWVIGYGHTLSAREGAAVSEHEAELLLQYDLIPVGRAINQATTRPLNQHQFDALASFAYSVGVDEFKASNVVERWNAGDVAQAADAMIGWPAKPSPEGPVRRRAAERALFIADPDKPTTLAGLLGSALPPVDEDGTILPFPATEELTATPVEAPPAESAPFPVANDAIVTPAPVTPEPGATDPVVEPAPKTATPDAAIPLDPRGPILRHEKRIRSDAPFDWKHGLPYVLVGAAGFIGFGVAMGTLRLAAMPSARSGEIALSGWLLAILSVGFIAYAGWKLYDRWGRSDPR